MKKNEKKNQILSLIKETNIKCYVIDTNLHLNFLNQSNYTQKNDKK